VPERSPPWLTHLMRCWRHCEPCIRRKHRRPSRNAQHPTPHCSGDAATGAHGNATRLRGWLQWLDVQHIKAATSVSEAAFCAVLNMVCAVASGALPHLPSLLQATLIPVKKATGGVRPVAVGEVWYCLAALCALAACPAHGLALLQLGVSIRGGSQNVGHALRAGVAVDSDCMTVEVDVTNVFNEVRRQCMIDAIEQRARMLLPMVAGAHGQPSRLLVLGSQDDTIALQWAIKQGDPLGALLSCLAVQPALEAVQQAHVGVRPLGSFDVPYLQGKPRADGVGGAFQTLCGELE
jgi:hypothetical protein